MRTLVTSPRRRAPRGAACDESPRLWADEPLALATVPALAEPAVLAAPLTPPSSAGSLDELISSAWAGLGAEAPVACPVCSATMTPRWSAGAGVVGGRCGGCGSTLE
jgi:hypothetical protein